MKGFISLIIIIAAIGIFYFGIDPLYNDPANGIKVLEAQVADYNKALDNSAKLRAVRGQLIDKYNNLDKTNVDRIQKFLPDGVDNVRLILDINGIASNYGMSIKNIKIEGGPAVSPANQQNPIGSIRLSFSVVTSYENYVQFLSDLERSLRLVDVVAISFTTDKNNITTYNTTLQTYWLK
jgi:Tfp pilus assembly protein PilO